MGPFYFASPFFLVGLVTLGIPFLLLLTKAKAHHVTPFSSVQFLQQILQRASNVIQWKRLLLLAIRISCLGLLALGFALPFLNRHTPFLSRSAQTHLVFLLDDSYSMGYREGKGTLFEKAKARIAGLARQQKHGRTLYSLYTFHDKPEPVIVATRKFDDFLNRLKKTPLSTGASHFSELNESVKEGFGNNPAVRTQIYVVSDFSVHEPDLKEKFFKGKFYPVSVQPAQYVNFALEGFHLPERFFLSKTEERIDISYSAYGMKGKQVQIHLYADGQELAAESVEIQESGRGIATFHQIFPSTGSVLLTAEASADNLEIDNRVYASLEVRNPLEILLVEEKPYAYPFQHPFFFFTQVIESSLDKIYSPWILVTQTYYDTFHQLDLVRYPLVGVAGRSGLDKKAFNALTDYIQKGGTVLFNFNKQEYPATSSNEIEQFLGGSLGPLQEFPDSQKPVFLSGVRYDHPIFRIFGGGKNGSLERIRMKGLVPFMPFEKTNYEVLAWADSKPALIEIKKGKGRILLWTSSLNLDWNLFALDPLYVPFVFELLKYSTGGSLGRAQILSVGESLQFPASVFAGTKSMNIKNPKGETITLYQDQAAGVSSLSLNMPGFYEWLERKGESYEKHWAASNLEFQESEPDYLSVPDPRRLLPSAGTPTEEKTAARNFFYLPLFYLLLVLCLAEPLVANRLYKPDWV